MKGVHIHFAKHIVDDTRQWVRSRAVRYRRQIFWLVLMQFALQSGGRREARALHLHVLRPCSLGVSTPGAPYPGRQQQLPLPAHPKKLSKFILCSYIFVNSTLFRRNACCNSRAVISCVWVRVRSCHDSIAPVSALGIDWWWREALLNLCARISPRVRVVGARYVKPADSFTGTYCVWEPGRHPRWEQLVSAAEDDPPAQIAVPLLGSCTNWQIKLPWPVYLRTNSILLTYKNYGYVFS